MVGHGHLRDCTARRIGRLLKTGSERQQLFRKRVSATIRLVAWIIDYQQVLDRTRELGLRCVYYNSGAFAHADSDGVRIVGWLGPDDPTIRVDLPATLIRVGEPYAENLADRLLTV